MLMALKHLLSFSLPHSSLLFFLFPFFICKSSQVLLVSSVVCPFILHTFGLQECQQRERERSTALTLRFFVPHYNKYNVSYLDVSVTDI